MRIGVTIACFCEAGNLAEASDALTSFANIGGIVRREKGKRGENRGREERERGREEGPYRLWHPASPTLLEKVVPASMVGYHNITISR